MTEQHPKKGFFHSIELSAVLMLVGIIVLFSGAIIVTLIAPSLIDSTWTQPTTSYQVQMYEIADPHFYISSSPVTATDLEAVYHLKKAFSLLAFQETETLRILAPPELEKYVNRYQSDAPLNLTSSLLLLRYPSEDSNEAVQNRKKQLQEEWAKTHSENLPVPDFVILELFQVQADEAFALASAQEVLENWVDSNFTIIDKNSIYPHHNYPGVIFVNNPMEYRIIRFESYGKKVWAYSPQGEPIAHLEELTGSDLGFRSRQELIQLGEEIYAQEGCWYCHTDQTRTLVQDVVLNGSDSYPCPPSSPNEYVYNHRVTFPGTHRIGPDMSRVAIKRPGRDWHRGHFWAPQSISKGSIMPAFQHFFDSDPRGTSHSTSGIPNYKFEAIFQYLMTKGSRITPPNQAWWLGKDPVHTKEIIEGPRK